MKLIKVIKSGLYGVVDGELLELPLGMELKVDEVPEAYIGRVEVLNEADGELEVATGKVNKKSKGE